MSPGTAWFRESRPHVEEIATMELMLTALARPRKTIEDLHALPDDVRAELIDGEVYVSPTAFEPHQSAVVEILYALRDHVGRVAGGRVFVAPFEVHLPSGAVVEPDVFWVAPARLEIVRQWVFGAPDLVVEVVSPAHPERDRIVKRDLYALNGVREYWVAEPAMRSVEVLALEQGHYRPAGWFTAGSRLVSPSLPGFSAAIDDLFPLRGA
jgi:Uma2 family endonuclease